MRLKGEQMSLDRIAPWMSTWLPVAFLLLLLAGCSEPAATAAPPSEAPQLSGKILALENVASPDEVECPTAITNAKGDGVSGSNSDDDDVSPHCDPENRIGTVMLGDEGAGGEVTAVVTVRVNTKVLIARGGDQRTGTVHDLAVGQHVDVWPLYVMESDPAQADALFILASE